MICKYPCGHRYLFTKMAERHRYLFLTLSATKENRHTVVGKDIDKRFSHNFKFGCFTCLREEIFSKNWLLGGSGGPKKIWKKIFFNFFFQSCLESSETHFYILFSHLFFFYLTPLAGPMDTSVHAGPPGGQKFEKIITAKFWLLSLPSSNLKRFDQTVWELSHYHSLGFGSATLSAYPKNELSLRILTGSVAFR